MTVEPNVQEVQVIEKKECYHGFYQLHKYALKIPKYDGSLGKTVFREVADRGDAVGILLYDADCEAIVFVEQFRPGAFFAREYPWILECVAGIVEKGETVQEVAYREAVEESGCSVKDMEPIAEYFSSPGGMTERLTLFCGCVDSRECKTYGGLENEGEDIRVRVLKTKEVFQMLQDRKIKNAMTLIACQWFVLNHQRLKEKWGTK